MNEYDSEIVKTILHHNHYQLVDQPADAGIIFLNTCSVREHAHEKVYQRLHVLKQLRKKNKRLIIGILGCMAQNLRRELLDNNIGVDIIVGPDNYKNLVTLIKKAAEQGEKGLQWDLSEYETYSDIYPIPDNRINAYIAIMRGCNNFCSFCIVPYVRGRERSREPENIVEEAEKIADKGIPQITLLGQNVNSYKYNNYDFSDLMVKVSKVEGLKRIRFTSPHPKDFPMKLIETMADNEKICKHIHLPLQAGNDRILNIMNRTYTQKEYITLVDTIKMRIPEIVLTTDIIVGFPSETDEEFQDTLKVMKEVEFDSAFMFKYSERQHTIAQRKYPDDIPDNIKTARMTRLVELQRRLSKKKNNQAVGKIFKVLVEGSAKKSGQLMGRNDGNKICVFTDQGQKAGEFVKVKVEEATTHTLIGKVI
jgi:tRNA-2-methylthio-N6-dimethylallyladenosine synthase